MAEPSKEWTASALQHHDGPGDAPADDTNKRAGILHMPTVRRLGKQKKGSTSPMDWGMPGELTKEEVDVFVSFVWFCLCPCRLCNISHRFFSP
mmetsp:Transcript_20129/g.29578  ORF Transcript_20129/g.29578 Transcript_20129/m.29578 type:complete len:93 (+) Transcript_20129:139-417(+)